MVNRSTYRGEVDMVDGSQTRVQTEDNRVLAHYRLPFDPVDDVLRSRGVHATWAQAERLHATPTEMFTWRDVGVTIWEGLRLASELKVQGAWLWEDWPGEATAPLPPRLQQAPRAPFPIDPPRSPSRPRSPDPREIRPSVLATAPMHGPRCPVDLRWSPSENGWWKGLTFVPASAEG